MNANKQRGSTAIGVILGVLIGLGVALGVAVYVMKVPTPFNSKSTSRTPAQDAAEAKKNKDWDPNAALSNKPVVKPTDTVAPTVQPATPAASPVPASPTADAAVEYYVQVGAFRSEGDAQALRGKLALSNFEGKVVEREQSGQRVFRVRVGPFANQAAGDKAKASLDAAGFDTMVIRAQR